MYVTGWGQGLGRESRILGASARFEWQVQVNGKKIASHSAFCGILW
jgi:hypothetical protein